MVAVKKVNSVFSSLLNSSSSQTYRVIKAGKEAHTSVKHVTAGTNKAEYVINTPRGLSETGTGPRQSV